MTEQTVSVKIGLVMFFTYLILGIPFSFFGTLLVLWLAEKFANRFLGGLPKEVPTAGDLWRAGRDAWKFGIDICRKVKSDPKSVFNFLKGGR